MRLIIVMKKSNQGSPGVHGLLQVAFFNAMQNIHYVYLDVDTVTVFEFGDQYLTPFTVLKDFILI